MRASPGAILAVLSLAAFMAGLDLFIVNVAFDDIGRDFAGASLSSLSWVLNGYALAFARRVVPEQRLEKPEALPDVFGAGVLTVAIAALSLALVKAPEWGYVTTPTLSAVLVSLALMAVFAGRSRSHASPVVEPLLLRVPAFLWSNVTMLWFSIGFGANLLANILWMQRGWHFLG